jgi:hypothetical protein
MLTFSRNTTKIILGVYGWLCEMYKICRILSGCKRKILIEKRRVSMKRRFSKALRKALAVSLTLSMVVSVPVVANASDGETDTISGNWWTAWSSSYCIDTAYEQTTEKLEFTIKVEGSGIDEWNNFAAVFTNVKTDGVKAPAETSGYKEYAVIRGDNYGWGLYGDSLRYTGGCGGSKDVGGLDKDDFIAAIDNCTIKATVERTGDLVVMTYEGTGDNGTTFKRVASFCGDTTEGLYVFFTIDNAKITVTPSSGNDVTLANGAWWSAWTPSYYVGGTYDRHAEKKTAKFSIDVKQTDQETVTGWNNVNAVFANVQVPGGATDPNLTSEYKEYVVLRCDDFGWGNAYYTTKFTNTKNDFGTDEFAKTVSNCHIVATVEKEGDWVKLTYDVTGANGVSFERTAEFYADCSEGLYVFFGCDASTVSVKRLISYTVGAQVNMNDNTTMAFVTAISQEDFKKYNTNGNTIIEMGVYVKKGSDLTWADADTAATKIETSYVNSANVLDGSLSADYYAYRSIIKNVTDSTQEISALPYFIYTDGNEHYTIYGDVVTKTLSGLSAAE